MEMVGHTSIVYSVDSHESGLIVSGSEDCCAKIWKGECFSLPSGDTPGAFHYFKWNLSLHYSYNLDG